MSYVIILHIALLVFILVMHIYFAKAGAAKHDKELQLLRDLVVMLREDRAISAKTD